MIEEQIEASGSPGALEREVPIASTIYMYIYCIIIYNTYIRIVWSGRIIEDSEKGVLGHDGQAGWIWTMDERDEFG